MLISLIYKELLQINEKKMHSPPSKGSKASNMGFTKREESKIVNKYRKICSTSLFKTLKKF